MNQTNTTPRASAPVNTGPVSDVAPGLSRLSHEPIWKSKSGLMVRGGWIGDGANLYCVRHSRLNKPGCWSVDWQAPGFYVEQSAVVDDFGTLVRVGVSS